jgi:hypothetical protein
MIDMPHILRTFTVLTAFVAILALGGCGIGNVLPGQSGGTEGADGYTHFGTASAGGVAGPAAVNGFLWRASLDTVSFMPLASADAFGGVLITDWYAPPETPAERFKINVFVTGPQLRPDAIRAAVFRQTQDASGAWRDAAVDPGTARGLEDTVLTRARQLRAESGSQ